MGLGRHDFWTRQPFAAKIFPVRLKVESFLLLVFPVGGASPSLK